MNTIPLVPEKTRRVNLAVDQALLIRAQRLKIDIHTYLRLSLQEAVEALEEKESPYEYEVIPPETTEATFLSALVRSHDGGTNERAPNHSGPYTERIKEAAERAGRRSGT